MNATWLPIKELAAKVQSGELSAISLVTKSLDIIKQQQEFQAIISTLDNEALERAKAIDEAIAKSEQVGRLAGVPFIAKDNFLVFGPDTTAASNILKGFSAPYQATAINKLEAEGAICVAKSNLDAFAHGTSTENSDFFTTKNPHDKTKVPGGSSGGSAVSVVLEMAPFALGTDTGGSIRQPASFTGCVGFKPSYGLVSRSGVVAMASSTDVIGPLTSSVEDAALVLDVIAGKDDLDATTIERQLDYTELGGSLEGIKIGLIEEYMGEGLNDDVRQVIEQSVQKLKDRGAVITKVSIPSIDLALAVYYVLCPAEVSSNLSRYDGQRYGYSYPDAIDLDESYKKSRGIGFGKEAKRRIIIGTHVLSSGYYDAYYKRAQQVRTKLIKEFEEAFKSVDFLVGPVAPSTAFEIGANIDNPLQMYLCDIMTVAANIVGNPSVSLPAGLSDGMPVGVQLMSATKKDKELLSLAKMAEGALI
jgi:aspartyl-tRNA(Asn)/glutamyl-tRNA(Gln) amidotransferase subunit A